MLTVLGIAFASGLLGGITNSFVYGRGVRVTRCRVAGFVLIGVCSALIVPLGLNALGSDLISQAREDHLKILVFVGLCLLAVFLSGRLYPVGSMEAVVPVNDNTDASALNPTQKELEPPIQPADEQINVDTDRLAKGGLTPDDFKILWVMVRDSETGRTLESLMKDSELAEDRFQEIMPMLIAKGFFGQKIDESQKLRFYLTPRGRKALNSLLPE